MDPVAQQAPGQAAQPPVTLTADQALAMITQLTHSVQLLANQQFLPPVAPGTNTNSVPATVLRTIRVQTFDGARNDTVAHWIAAVKDYFEISPPMSEANKVLVASQHMTGDARRWYQVELRRNVVFPTFDQFCGAVKKEFLSATVEQQARDKLRRLRQTKSAEAYTDQFRRLLLLVNDMSDRDQVDAYVSGLKTAVQTQVRLGFPKTLSDATSAAQTVDSVLYATEQSARRSNSYYNPNSGKQERTAPAVNPNHAPMDLSTVTTEVKKTIPARRPVKNLNAVAGFGAKMRTALGDTEYDRRRANNLCYTCGKSGHQTKDCKQNPKAKAH